MKNERKSHPILGATLFALLLLFLLSLVLGLLAVAILGIIRNGRLAVAFLALMILGFAIYMFEDREELIHSFAGHDWDGCECRVCGALRHDFRNAAGRNPEDTQNAGTFPCTKCNRVFHRTVDPPEGCGNCNDCDGTGQIECYSCQSGQGGSWFEDCEYRDRLHGKVTEWME